MKNNWSFFKNNLRKNWTNSFSGLRRKGNLLLRTFSKTALKRQIIISHLPRGNKEGIARVGPLLKAAPHSGLWSHEPWSGKFKCLLWLSWSMKATVNVWISRFMVHETKAHRVVPPWKSVMTANWLQPWWQAIWHATIIWFKAFFSQESLRHNFCFKILSKKLPQEAQHQNLAWNYKP